MDVTRAWLDPDRVSLAASVRSVISVFQLFAIAQPLP